jgi:hypothetical protein
MNEEQWLSCTDPWPMLKFLSRGENHRKDRLFLVACCRSVWHLLVHPKCRELVDLAERHADGEAFWEELELGRDELELALDSSLM